MIVCCNRFSRKTNHTRIDVTFMMHDGIAFEVSRSFQAISHVAQLLKIWVCASFYVVSLWFCLPCWVSCVRFFFRLRFLHKYILVVSGGRRWTDRICCMCCVCTDRFILRNTLYRCAAHIQCFCYAIPMRYLPHCVRRLVFMLWVFLLSLHIYLFSVPYLFSRFTVFVISADFSMSSI